MKTILSLIEKAHANYKAQSELYEESRKLHNEIDAEKRIHVENIRKFEDGEVVNVYDSSGGLSGQAIIDGARCCLYVDQMNVTRNNYPENIEKDMSDVIYDVWAIKRDGTKSSKHFDSYNHRMREKDYKGGYPYIEKP